MIHVVVTPVNDEADFLPLLIESMVEQTIKPVIWAIVDDNSTDGSVEIMEKAASDYEWIVCGRARFEGRRARGARIAKLFNFGISLCGNNWEYCSKIDADMILPHDYFEKIFAKFEGNRGLGIASGNCRIKTVIGYKKENTRNDHTRGGLKTYKKACFDEIGGVREVDGWDGIDNALANMKEWKTENFHDIIAFHGRITGGRAGRLKSQFEAGKFAHRMGYFFPYIVARSVFEMTRWPYILSGVSMLLGFISCVLRKEAQFDEEDVLKFIREEQKGRLRISRIFGKTSFGK